jgi:hypothetical protein
MYVDRGRSDAHIFLLDRKRRVFVGPNVTNLADE